MSDSYKQVSIAVCERVKNRIFLKKNFPLIFKRSLLTFVDRYEIQSFMNRTIIEDSQHPECPIRNILARISDKWSLLVIYTLDRSDKQAIRFKELQREIPDISQKMLTGPPSAWPGPSGSSPDSNENVDCHPPCFRRRRLHHPHSLSRSAASSGICTDNPGTFADSTYQCSDRMGSGKQRRHHQRPKKSS